jgi:hypothetical protein
LAEHLPSTPAPPRQNAISTALQENSSENDRLGYVLILITVLPRAIDFLP